MIPVLRPSCTEQEIAAVTEVLHSGWWGMGPKCAELERRLAERHHYQHCVTVNSATAALHLALLASGVGPGDEVILPALTFVSTALAVEYELNNYRYCPMQRANPKLPGIALGLTEPWQHLDSVDLGELTPEGGKRDD